MQAQSVWCPWNSAQCFKNRREPVKMLLSLISNLVEDEYGRAY
jgi:hypothetical protein